MKKINVYEKILGLKRDLEMSDFVKIPLAVENTNFPEITVKIFTETIYLSEIGAYIVAVYNITEQKPQILVLGHTLFAAFKRWRADSMQDLIGKNFTIASKTSNGVAYHDLYGRGLLPMLSNEIIEEMDEYINQLFDIAPIECETDA